MLQSVPASTAATHPEWLVICDFDGTIADCDVTDGILTRFALPEWEQVETEWKAGMIGSRECMSRQVELVRATRDELDAYLDTVRIDPHFSAFVSDCSASGLPVIIVSDGIDYAIQRILARHGLDHLLRASNHLVATGGNTYRLDFPNSNAHCRAGSGTCKCAFSSGRAGLAKRLLVGDGSSDFCLAGEADLVFAKSKLLQRCRERQLPHRDCPNFSVARGLLADLGVAPAKLPRISPPRPARVRVVAANLEVARNG